jgi:hypothetical protein
VLLAQLGDRRLRRLDKQAVPGQPLRPVVGQRLGAGVKDHLPAARRGHHAGRHDQRDVVFAQPGQVHLLPVAEHVRARPHLGQRAGYPGGRGRRRTAAEHGRLVDQGRQRHASRRERGPFVLAGLRDRL